MVLSAYVINDCSFCGQAIATCKLHAAYMQYQSEPSNLNRAAVAKSSDDLVAVTEAGEEDVLRAMPASFTDAFSCAK